MSYKGGTAVALLAAVIQSGRLSKVGIIGRRKVVESRAESANLTVGLAPSQRPVVNFCAQRI
jgi:hypothetical protein